MKFCVGLYFSAVGFSHDSPENRRHDNHTSVQVENSFLLLLSVSFGQFLVKLGTESLLAVPLSGYEFCENRCSENPYFT
jgi:hypothetical protein